MFQAKLACQLRKVVVNCYTYYGMEEKLKGNTRKFSSVTKNNRKSSKMSPRKRNLIQVRIVFYMFDRHKNTWYLTLQCILIGCLSVLATETFFSYF